MDPIRKMHIRAWQSWLHIFYKTSEKCCFLPIYWNKSTNSLTFAKSHLRILMWATMLLYMIADTTYLTFTMCTVKYKEMPVDAILKLLSHGLSRLGACALIFGYSINFKSTISLLNQICKLHNELKECYYGDATALIKDGLLYVTFGTITVHIQPFGPTLQHFQERQSVRYWGSQLLPQQFYNSFFGIIIFGTIEFFLCCMAIFGTAFAAVQLIVYAQTTRHWLDVLTTNSKKPTISNISKNLSLYRILHVMNCVHNETCSQILWPIAQDVLCVVHVIVNALTIKCFFILPIPTRAILVLSAFAFAYFESSCFKAAADIYEISKKFRKHVSHQKSKRYRLVGQSLRCLRIQVSFAYYFEISTFNAFMQSVVDNTVNVMLAFFA